MLFELINNNAGLENWTGDISQIGPIYPFVGYEIFMVILGVAFWIIWHILQMKEEAQEWREDLELYGRKEAPRRGDDQL